MNRELETDGVPAPSDYELEVYGVQFCDNTAREATEARDEVLAIVTQLTAERDALAAGFTTAIEHLSKLYYLASSHGDFSNGVTYNGIDEGQVMADNMLRQIRAFLGQHDDDYAAQDVVNRRELPF